MKTNLKIEYVLIDKLNPYENNAKRHPAWQIDQLVKSIQDFGNCDPVVVWTNENGELEIVEGHGRVKALKKLNVDKVPVIYLDHLSDEQRRAYALVHNQTTMNTGWDFEALEQELNAISEIDMFDGFGFDKPNDDDSNGDLVEVKNTSGEIDVESFNDDKFDHECPRCGSKFND